jgi:hypothetical protein
MYGCVSVVENTYKECRKQVFGEETAREDLNDVCVTNHTTQSTTQDLHWTRQATQRGGDHHHHQDHHHHHHHHHHLDDSPR